MLLMVGYRTDNMHAYRNQANKQIFITRGLNTDRRLQILKQISNKKSHRINSSQFPLIQALLFKIRYSIVWTIPIGCMNFPGPISQERCQHLCKSTTKTNQVLIDSMKFVVRINIVENILPQKVVVIKTDWGCISLLIQCQCIVCERSFWVRNDFQMPLVRFNCGEFFEHVPNEHTITWNEHIRVSLLIDLALYSNEMVWKYWEWTLAQHIVCNHICIYRDHIALCVNRTQCVKLIPVIRTVCRWIWIPDSKLTFNTTYSKFNTANWATVRRFIV